jgi:transcription termination factor Rho
VGRAVTAGRKALREAESRVPRDVRRQFERSIKDGQKTLTRAIDQLQAQVRRTAKQADVEKALKRLDGLSKQVQQLARGATSQGAAKPRRTTRKASGTTKRASTKKRRAAPARKPTARPAARRTAAAPPARAPRRAAARRAAAPAPQPEATPEPGEGGS